MDETLTHRSHAVLKLVADAPDCERDSLIEAHCAGDPKLRERVMSLVRALDDSQGFLETPALHNSRARLSADLQPGVDVVGGYRILGVIGSGGMATVYEAIQERPHRRVALKVLRRALAKTSALQRFAYETEVLARLRHPGICQIFEAGAHDDGHGGSTPFFAMEHIANARPLNEHAREKGLDFRQRLELFVEVCDAVQHGHQNGVIHRDLKPSNVLVDMTGRPKVIDFGVARSTDPEQAWITRNSELGQLVGTLNYMSPEQCAGAEDVDARADIYSLGVMLYQLLCDRLPHDLSGVPIPEALRIVQQDTPPRPSAVNPRLRGDLEAILLMAMEKSPDRRYKTVAALAMDIRRSLRHETIEARSPTIMYQCRLFARRNRGLVGSIAAIAAVLVVSTVFSTGFAYRAVSESRARRAAEIAAVAERDHAVWRSYVASIAASFSAFQSGDNHSMRSLLDGAPEKHRGWEWRFLNAAADRSRETIDAHRDMIFGFTSSPDRALLATACRDGAVKVWRREDRAVLAEAEPFGESAICVAFSPSGARLASGSVDGELRVSEAASGATVATVENTGGSTFSLAFLSETIVATGSGESGALWSAETGERFAEFSDQPGGVHVVACSPDGRLFATANNQGAIWIRDAADARPIHKLQTPSLVGGLSFNEDGSLLAAGGEEGRIAIWRTGSGQLVHEFTTPQSLSFVRAVIFDSERARLITGHGDRSVVIWTLAGPSPEVIARLRGHGEGVSGLVLSPDGASLYSASWDKTIKLWDIGPNDLVDPIRALRGHTDRVIATRFSPDGAVVASTSLDATIRLWDPDLGECLGALRGHTGPVIGLAFSPDGLLIASSSNDNTTRIWDARTGALERVIEGHGDDVWTVAFSPDGRRLATGSDDKTVRVWDTATWKTVCLIEGHEARVVSLQFSPDGRTIATTSRDQTVRLWNATSGREVRRLEGHAADVFAVVFSHDGELVYSGSRDHTVRVWSVESGECLHTLLAPGHFITSLSLSEDGERLAAGSWFGEVILWDVASREMVASFRGQNSAIRSIAFSPDGRWLAATSYEHLIRLFDAAPYCDRMNRRDQARAGYAAAESHLDTIAGGADNGSLVQRALDTSDEALRPWVLKTLLRRSLAAAEAAAPPSQPSARR